MYPRSWDIFCRVIDNFGDIGVSWRLARQLAQEHGAAVRLWVDGIESLRALCSEIDPVAPCQTVQGVTVFQSGEAADFAQPAEVVIEAFGCGLPPRYLAAMAAREKKPLWIVLEYLSAEPWVREHHGLPSPHPRLDLPRYFFFPGVTEGSGGVLRERDLLERRDAFDAHVRRQYWTRLGFDPAPPAALTVSLFAYPHAPYRVLLDTLAQGAVPAVVAIPDGPLALRVRDDFDAGVGDRYTRGNLELRFIPFVSQPQYDALLWACDINFVRGEDSFVRAQWAGRPFVWHIYPQDKKAHVVKLNAFLAQYGAELPQPVAQAVGDFWRAWNGVEGAPPLAEAWSAFVSVRRVQQRALGEWQAHLQRLGEVAGNLVKFSQKMI